MHARQDAEALLSTADHRRAVLLEVSRRALAPAAFERLAGEGLKVRNLPVAMTSAYDVPELVAEAALLQARLDWFQTRLARIQRGPRG